MFGGITLWDWAIIALYLAGIILIGAWAARKVKSAASFFISDRKFGKAMMVFFGFGTGTHSDQAVTVAAKSYSAGAAGIWYQWLWIFVTPFFWVLAPLFRRMRAVTTADYFEARYDRSVSVLFALVGMLNLMVNIGVMLKASSEVVVAVSGEGIRMWQAVTLMTAMFVIYGIAGGLNAAIATDFVQGILTVVLSFLILPFALAAVNGMAGLHQAIANPKMLEIVASSYSAEITAFYIAILSLNALVGWVTQPHNMAVSAAGKTELEGRVGVTGGMFAKRICTVAWMLTGVCAIAIYGADRINPDHAYGFMARDLLPTIAPGLVGLFIASMLAGVMSSCDAFMVTSSALFTENIYRPLIVRGKPDRHYVLVGRIAAAVVVACGILFAFAFESVVKGLETFWKVSAMMGIAFWVGLFWRRATVAGAWAGTLVSFAVLLFTGKIAFGDFTLWDFNERFARALPEFLVYKGTLRLHWQMIFYLTAGLVTVIVVSLFTRRVSDKKLDRFYECLRTPITPGEPETEPFSLPEGVKPAPRRVLFAHPDFEIPRPQWISLIGFVVSWAVVGLLIAALYWIFSLGTG